MYTGAFLLFLRLGFLFRSVIGLVLAGLLDLPLLRCSAAEEERQMLKTFGKEYLDHKKNTAF
jgi:protein-S-isoprenylcysteine O-methyltransferase Ste14